MSTIVELVNNAYLHWNDAKSVGEIGIEMESRTRLDLSRAFLQRALSLDPEQNPYWYHVLAFAYFRDVRNYNEEGERTIIDGIETTGSLYLKAVYVGLLEDEDAAELLARECAESMILPSCWHWHTQFSGVDNAMKLWV